ncbi:MAG: DUF4129 domain-containing protein [Lapillicoccus sp.]
MMPRGPRTVRVPRGRQATVLVIALATAALALVTVVASSGPVGFVTVPPPVPGELQTLPPLPSTTTTTAVSNALSTNGLNPNDLPPLPDWVVVLLQSLVVVLVVLAGLALLRAGWRHRPHYRSRVQEEYAIVPLPDLPEELTRTADARMALLLQTGDPRNAIVACWLDLEDSAAEIGLPRLVFETSAEYTTRVLKTWDLAPDAMGALAALYREARFSRHEITEAHRDDAVRRLSLLHEELWRVSEEISARRELEEAARAAQWPESDEDAGGLPRPPRSSR